MERFPLEFGPLALALGWIGMLNLLSRLGDWAPLAELSPSPAEARRR